MRFPAKMAALLILLAAPVVIQAAEKEPPEQAQEERLPMARQMELKRSVYQAELAELQTAFAEAYDPAEAMVLQRKISAHKLNYEISLYRIQLDHALKTANNGYADELLAAISLLEKQLPVIESPDAKEARK